MRIVIVGAGEVGTEIARQMVDEKKDVVLIEKNPTRAKQAANFLEATVIQGEGSDPEVLKEAGVASADVFIAATTIDEVNLISCFIVDAEYDVPVKIARVRNVQYTESQAFTPNLSGVDFLVNPDLEAAIDIFHTVEQGAANTVTVFDNTDIQMREYYVDDDSYLRGKSVKELRMELKESFIITGIVHKGEVSIPGGDYVVSKDDHVYIVARKYTFRKLARCLGGRGGKLRRILIVGGTAIGTAVAEMLIERGRSIVVLDKDYERCKELAEELPEALVLNGDISDNRLYFDENITTMDAVVTCTNNEELNILSGLYAKSLGVKRAVALVEKTSYLTLATGIGIDSTVTPKFCAINRITKYIRKGNVQSVHSVFDGNAEAIEATISKNSPLADKMIKDLELPEGCLIAAIKRGRKSIVPDGNFTLMADDTVIFFILRTKVTELEGLIS